MQVTPFTIEVPDAVLDDLYRHYKAMVDGLGSHFIHEKGKGPNPLPLVITHGWPGSFFEMYKLIPQLTDPSSQGAGGRNRTDTGLLPRDFES